MPTGESKMNWQKKKNGGGCVNNTEGCALEMDGEQEF
jgi:hypothetical protein